MSTRLTHHRRSLSDRMNAWLCQYADDRQIKRAQNADDACERINEALLAEQDKVRGLKYANEQLRNKLGQVEFDRDAALDACGVLSTSIRSLEQKNERLLSLNRMLLDVVQGRSQLVEEVEAFLAHPSNGGEG